MIAHDKYLHAMGGCIIALVFLPMGIPTAAFMVAFAAIGKEIVDRASGKGTPEVWDAVATLGAGLVTIAIHTYY